MMFYGLPAPLAPGLEDKIIAAAARNWGMISKSPRSKAPGAGTQGILPKSPADSLAAIKVHDGLRVELVASEPMVQSPVAIDFGPDGKMWVAEMRDYGCKDGETCPPNGRVSVLEDRDGDGIYETSTVFLDKIAQPMGVKVWRKGVLISAAPDLLYAEDTDGDGKADVVQKIFTGFSVENPQARLNLLTMGLDGWLRAVACSSARFATSRASEFDIGNRDFRLHPEKGEIEAENGYTENSRVRDEWGNWFGTLSGAMCTQYPLADRYFGAIRISCRQNSCVDVPTAAATKLYPRGKLVLFELSVRPANRHPPAASRFIATIYSARNSPATRSLASRSTKWCIAWCSNQRVRSSSASGPPEEAESEFLASTDNWFRPVQARTGPMARCGSSICTAMSSNTRAGFPRKRKTNSTCTPAAISAASIACCRKTCSTRRCRGSINSQRRNSPPPWIRPTATQRDMIQQMLVWRGDAAAVAPLVEDRGRFVAAGGPHASALYARPTGKAPR